jgi:hypothetical protein
VDKTGITVKPMGQPKILALKGRHQIGVLSSAEKGETVTAEMCFSSGAFMPPMFFFQETNAAGI